jgi:hypothetical protein
MKTTNVIILVGVLGVGGVGAYMYMKNKQAKEALLTGSLPATNQGGATTSGTTTSGTTTSGTSSLSTTSDGVSPSDANLNLANATILVAERATLQTKIKAPLPKMLDSTSGSYNVNPEYSKALTSKALAQKQLVALDANLAKLGYKVDATGALVKV